MPTTYRVTGDIFDIFNVEDTLRFLHSDEKNFMNFFPLPVMFWRDVTKGKSHASVVCSAGFAPPQAAIAVTAGEFPPMKSWLSASRRVTSSPCSAISPPSHDIYRWLLRFVGNETVAEDLLSDVFFDVWQQTGRFEGRSAVTTWLLSIARFKALSARRRRTDAELDKTIETTVADSADDPEIALQKKGRSELLRQALMKLSPHHREIIDLVYYHEKSVDDCAHPWHCGRDREDPHVLCPQEAC